MLALALALTPILVLILILIKSLHVQAAISNEINAAAGVVQERMGERVEAPASWFKERLIVALQASLMTRRTWTWTWVYTHFGLRPRPSRLRPEALK